MHTHTHSHHHNRHGHAERVWYHYTNCPWTKGWKLNWIPSKPGWGGIPCFDSLLSSFRSGSQAWLFFPFLFLGVTSHFSCLEQSKVTPDTKKSKVTPHSVEHIWEWYQSWPSKVCRPLLPQKVRGPKGQSNSLETRHLTRWLVRPCLFWLTLFQI